MVSGALSDVVQRFWEVEEPPQKPTDCASRGYLAPGLVDHSLWWGTGWLVKHESDRARTPALDTTSLPELRTLAAETFLLNKCSSLDNLLGVIAWINRFMYNYRHPQNKLWVPSLLKSDWRLPFISFVRCKSSILSRRLEFWRQEKLNWRESSVNWALYWMIRDLYVLAVVFRSPTVPTEPITPFCYPSRVTWYTCGERDSEFSKAT